jgi:hypothetical protein
MPRKGASDAGPEHFRSPTQNLTTVTAEPSLNTLSPDSQEALVMKV